MNMCLLQKTSFQLCRETAASWVETHHEEGIEDELVAINLLFDHWDVLGLKGGAIKLFGRVEAFSIGELMMIEWL